jgi:hypothetical protein
VGLQNLPATLILADGAAARALRQIGRHERPVGRLRIRVELQQSLADHDRALGRAVAEMDVEETTERCDRRFSQATLLLAPPLLEGLAGQDEAIEEIAAIERDGSLESCGRALGDGALEGDCVDLDPGRIEVEIVAQRANAGGVRVVQGFPGQNEGLPQAGARPFRAAVGPQQGGQALAPLARPGAHPQNGQKRLGLSCRKANRRAGIEGGLERAQESDLQSHRLSICRGCAGGVSQITSKANLDRRAEEGNLRIRLLTLLLRSLLRRGHAAHLPPRQQRHRPIIPCLSHRAAPVLGSATSAAADRQ